MTRRLARKTTRRVETIFAWLLALGSVGLLVLGLLSVLAYMGVIHP